MVARSLGEWGRIFWHPPMAFVNELVPEHEKQRLLAISSDEPNARRIELWKWTVDRGRDAFLFQTHKWGGSYEGTIQAQHLVLGLQGQLVRFLALSTNVAASPENGVLVWQVKDISLPQGFGLDMGAVQAIIREALEARGWLYDNSTFNVRVDFL